MFATSTIVEATQRLAITACVVRWLVDTGAVGNAAGTVADQMPAVRARPCPAEASWRSPRGAHFATEPQLADCAKISYIGVAGQRRPVPREPAPIPRATPPQPHDLRVGGPAQTPLFRSCSCGASSSATSVSASASPLSTTSPTQRGSPSIATGRTVGSNTGLPQIVETRAGGEITVVEYHGLRVEMPHGLALGQSSGDQTVDARPAARRHVPGRCRARGSRCSGALTRPSPRFSIVPRFLRRPRGLPNRGERSTPTTAQDHRGSLRKGLRRAHQLPLGGGGDGSPDRPIVVDPKVSRDQPRMAESPEPAVRPGLDGKSSN